MNKSYLFRVSYNRKAYKYVWAETKWEAFDRVYWRMALEIPNINRSKIKVVLCRVR